jgi:ATP-binding cassette subfamily B protein
MSASSDTTELDLRIEAADRPLAGLWRLTTGYRLIYLGAVLGVGVAAALRTGNYLLLRYFVDDVLARERFDHTLALIALGFVGLALARGVVSFFSGKLSARTAEGITRRLREYLFDHIQRLSFTYHDRAKTGELIQRATSDVDAVRRFYADQAIGVGRIVLLFAINFAALLRLNAQLALVSTVVVVPIIAMSVFFFKRISKAYEAFQEQEAKVSATLQENLTGVRVVKAFARQPYERDKFRRENWEQFERGRRLLALHALFWPVSDVLCAGQMLGGYIAGALMAIDGTITVGTYLAYAGLLVWIIWPMRNLGRLIVHTSTGLVSYGRLTELTKEMREPLSGGTWRPPDGVRGEIVFSNVCFDHSGESAVLILKDISFRCEPGQVVGLLGSTGSGKTSLVNLLPRFYEYSGGSLTLDGVEMREYPRDYVRRQIGIVEQEPFLFSRTIRENIAYGAGREVSEREVEDAARAAAIHADVASFADGYDTLVGEKGVTLSGGQKQRVAIARTLLKDPRILILDDATSSVDAETETEIRQALKRLMDGRTTFVIAHRIQSVKNADLILVLDQGQVVQRGKHADLMAQDGIYRRMYDLQVRIEGELETEMRRASETPPIPDGLREKEAARVAQ